MTPGSQGTPFASLPQTPSSGPTEVEQTFVWGTNVNVNDSQARFRRFFTNFDDPATMSPLYPAMLEEIIKTDQLGINIDCNNLYEYDRELYMQLIAYPQELIPIFDLVINDLAADSLGMDPQSRIQVRTFNLRERKHMRDLNPQDIDQMISVRGMISRTSGVIPDLKQAFFQCGQCGASAEPVFIDRGRIDEPQVCTTCEAKFTMRLIHNRCVFANKQLVRMQETPDAIPEGETPHSVSMCVFDDLVDVGKPGDRVEITGIFRAVPVRVSSGQRTVKSLYKTYIDVIHVRKDEKSRIGVDSNPEQSREFQIDFAENDETTARLAQKERAIRDIAGSPNVYERLMRSVAPNIFGLDDVKRGILCQLFGGTNKDIPGTASGRLRGDINILLCGDPGVSKSQLLGYVHKLAPRGIYTSGRGSSAVGLTAYVTKDPETKEHVLESGALVLSDKGVCCIDEFDKMSDNARSMLHEVMEQQTVSVAKAGIICTLNARTSILASANPVGSRYNPSMSVIENLQLPPTLLSRFDLIYLLLDRADEQSDRKLARHLVSLHFSREETEPAQAQDQLIAPEMLADYIQFARANVNPILGDDAAEDLKNGYVELRRLGGSRNVITATPRQLESLIRLSESLARMKLRDVVGRDDVQEAIRLMNVALQQSATDKTTGLIDMDNIMTGLSALGRRRRDELGAEIKRLFSEGQRSKTLNDIFRDIQAQSTVQVTLDEIRNAASMLGDGFTIVGDVLRREG